MVKNHEWILFSSVLQNVDVIDGLCMMVFGQMSFDGSVSWGSL